MKQMKYWQALIPMAIWALVAAGCSGSSSPGATPEGPPTEPEVVELEEVTLPSLVAGGASYAVAVNNESAPRIAGIAISDEGVAKGVVWTVDGSESSTPALLEALDDDKASAAYGINSSGIAVGEAENGDGSVAVFWNGNGAPTALSANGFLNNGRSAAFAISDDGFIVGEAQVSNGRFVPVLWTSTGADPQELPTTGNGSGAAFFIDDGGWIVGEVNGEAVYWTLDANNDVAGPLALPKLNGHERSVALGVDGAGRIVGENEIDGAVHAVLWVQNGNGFEAIDLGPASAQTINDAGHVAGYTEGIAPASRAAIWTQPQLFPTEPAALLEDNVFSQAYGMNQANFIVGTKNHEAFVAVPQ